MNNFFAGILFLVFAYMAQVQAATNCEFCSIGARCGTEEECDAAFKQTFTVILPICLVIFGGFAIVISCMGKKDEDKDDGWNRAPANDEEKANEVN